MSLLSIARDLRSAASGVQRDSASLRVAARRDFYRNTTPGVDISILGIPELQRKLLELPLKVQKKVVRQALRKQGKYVQAEAKARVAVGESGDLKRTIKVRAMKRRKARPKEFGISVQIGTGLQEGRGTFTELGTSRQAAQPSLRPALAENRERILRDLGIDIGRGIEAEAAK